MSALVGAIGAVFMTQRSEWLPVSEAARRLNTYVDKVRAYADSGYLRSRRAPRLPGSKGPGHRRISAASIAELEAILDAENMPETERDNQLEALRRHNLGIPADGETTN